GAHRRRALRLRRLGRAQAGLGKREGQRKREREGQVMRWLLLAALLCSRKTEKVAPSLPPAESVGAKDLAFWKWFGADADEVAKVKDGHEPIADQLAAELHKIEDGLVFELGLGKSG